MLTLKSGYSFKYTFDINEIVTDWQKTNNRNIYLSYPYLKALQDTVSSDVTFIYGLLYYQDRVVGLLYFQWIKITDDFFNQEKFPQEINSKLRSYLLKKIKGSLLLCGNFFATGTNGFFFNELVPTNTIPQIIKKLRCDLCLLHNQNRGLKFVMVKEFWAYNELEIQRDLNKKTSKIQVDVNMVLSINPLWRSYENYLEFMSTKYRRRAKSVAKKTVDIVFKDFSADLIALHQDRIEFLYNAVLETASFNMIKLKKNSFHQLKQELKDRFIFRGYFKDDVLIAFSTSCLNIDYLDANYVGIDYELNKTQPIYQRILYDYVSLAIESNVKELRLGRTAETMKSALGALPVEMNLYVKHMNPLLNVLLKPLTKFIKPSSYQIRSPFKQL